MDSSQTGMTGIFYRILLLLIDLIQHDRHNSRAFALIVFLLFYVKLDVTKYM